MPLRNERVIAVKKCGGKIGANSLILSLQYIDLTEPKSGAPVSVLFSDSL